MTKPIVRLVTIEPVKWIYFNAWGETPELRAFDLLWAWAEPRGLMADLSRTFIFGRNNPPPSPERVEYGYDAGLTVDPAYEVEGDVAAELFSRGPYAVARTNLAAITRTWIYLYEWVESNDYETTGPGWEELLTSIDENDLEGTILDLWLPVAPQDG